MATRGARAALSAVVVTAAMTGLLVVAAPAYAQPNVQLEGIGNVELRVGGGSQTVQIRVRNTAEPGLDPAANTARDVRFTLTLPLGNEGVGIVSAGEGCNVSGNPPTRMDCAIPEIPPGQERAIVVQIGVDPSSPLPAGQERNGTAQVTLATGGTQSFNIRLRGPEQAPTITQVAGFVTDQATGEPIGDARVILIDGAGNEHSRGTDSQGRFDIRPEPSRPIVPGRIALVAQKTGYDGQQYHHDREVGAGESVTNIQLVMINLQATASPSPQPSESPTPEPSPTAVESAAAPPPEEEDGGLTFFTKLMIFLGVLLVLLGVGAIVFMIWRRRREEDEDGGFDDADDPIGPRGPSPTPGSRGIYRPTPTQVAGSGAATQVIPRAGAPGSGLPAVGPNPALAKTSLLAGGAGPADATTVLPRADDPTRIAGDPGDAATRVMGGPGDAATRVMGAAGAADATQVMGSVGAAGTASGSATPTSGPGLGAPSSSPPTPRRPGPQPPTYNRPSDRPYAGGYDQGGAAGSSRYGEPGYGGAHAGGGSGGYDEPTGRFDGPGYGSEPRSGGAYGRASHDRGYGPDPYTQPSTGYGDYDADPYASGAHSYSGGGYGSEGYRDSYDNGGYEAGDYERGYASGGSYGSYGSQGYQSADYSTGGYDQPTSGHGYDQPGAGQYGQPGGGYASGGGYEGYYDETNRPRPRHSGTDRGWPED